MQKLNIFDKNLSFKELPFKKKKNVYLHQKKLFL